MAARVLASAIPMRGRIIHNEEGTDMQVYDPDEEVGCWLIKISDTSLTAGSVP